MSCAGPHTVHCPRRAPGPRTVHCPHRAPSLGALLTLCTVCVAQAGASVHADDKDGKTPLHQAAYHGHVKVVHALLGAGASVQATGYNLSQRVGSRWRMRL